jgi:hypothetical protein
MSSRCRRIGEADQPTFDEAAIRERGAIPDSNIKALRIAVFAYVNRVSAIQCCRSSDQQTGHILGLATKFVSI